MPNYYIWTIGCQMNKAESERLASGFEELGYLATDTIAEADLVVLNSCVVRQSAEDRVINKLYNLKQLKKANPNALIAVTGCLVNGESDSLKKRFPYVDYFFKPGDTPPWLAKDLASSLPLLPSPAVYVTISQGCDNFCSYCIVPYRRGRERSRTITEITCEVKELVRRGARQVTLLGQNVDSYGHDLSGKPGLADLLTELNSIDGLARIRFLTNHPKDMSPGLISAIAGLDKVCEHLTLPVQSGSNDILKAMRRGYTVEQYRQLIAQIRQQIPGVALSTDVIVGFPSETENQFQQTMDLLSDIKFDTVHIAAYSSRQGTIAAREFEDNVPLPEKQRRLRLVEQAQEIIASAINANLLGKEVEVLIEGKTKGKWYGRTRSDKLVFFNSKNNCLGQLVAVKVDRTGPWSSGGNKVESDNNQEEG
jgi:tRNA-2-methylthio-N6-dimethylallyladenosine synthase